MLPISGVFISSKIISDKGIPILPAHNSFAQGGFAEWDQVIGRTYDAEVVRSKVSAPAEPLEQQFVLILHSKLYKEEDKAVTDIPESPFKDKKEDSQTDDSDIEILNIFSWNYDGKEIFDLVYDDRQQFTMEDNKKHYKQMNKILKEGQLYDRDT